MSQHAIEKNMSNRFYHFEFAKSWRNLIVDVICGLLILLFIYASVSKLITYNKSFIQMNSQPFPDWMTPYLTIGIPVLEVAISLLLIFDKTKLFGLISSFILMSVFTLYIGLVLFETFGRIPCSCGGVIGQLSWSQHMFFNLFFVVISGIGIILQKKRK